MKIYGFLIFLSIFLPSYAMEKSAVPSLRTLALCYIARDIAQKLRDPIVHADAIQMYRQKIQEALPPQSHPDLLQALQGNIKLLMQAPREKTIKPVKTVRQPFYAARIRTNPYDNNQLAMSSKSDTAIISLHEDPLDIVLPRRNMQDIVYTKDGLAVIDNNYSIHLYNCATGEFMRTLFENNHRIHINDFCYNEKRDCIFFITATSTLSDDLPTSYSNKLMGTSSTGPQVILEHNGPLEWTTLTCNTEGNTIAVMQQNQLMLYDIDATTKIRDIQARHPRVAVYSPDDTAIAFDSNEDYRDYYMCVLNLASGKQKKYGILGGVSDIVYNPHSRINQLAVTPGKGDVYIINPLRNERQRLESHVKMRILTDFSHFDAKKGESCPIAYSADGKLLAVANRGENKDLIELYETHIDEEIAISDFMKAVFEAE